MIVLISQMYTHAATARHAYPEMIRLISCCFVSASFFVEHPFVEFRSYAQLYDALFVAHKTDAPPQWRGCAAPLCFIPMLPGIVAQCRMHGAAHCQSNVANVTTAHGPSPC